MILVGALAFLILACLLLWVVVYAHGPWALKLAAIIIVPAFMFAIWFGYQSFSGYPYKTSTWPKRALFVSGYYVDPDPQTHSKGAIYVWLILPKHTSANPFAYNPHGDPRAYKLPYSEQDAQQIQKANQAAQKGQPVEIRAAKHKPGGKGKRGGGITPGSRAHITAYSLPPAQPATKHSN